MTNKIATVSVSASYLDPDAQRASLARILVDCPFQAQAHNEIPVPDTQASATVYSVDFGAVVADATFVVVHNLTANGLNAGQDLILGINGTGPLYRIPPGGFLALGTPGAPGAVPLTAMTLTTTATQAGLGKIATHVFGDPT